VFYAKDAMSGLDLANRLMEKILGKRLVTANRMRQREICGRGRRPWPLSQPDPERSSPMRGTPFAPGFKTHVLDDFRVEDIFKYINPVMLVRQTFGVARNN
jgi:cobalamin-dependent methionine synthase I